MLLYTNYSLVWKNLLLFILILIIFWPSSYMEFSIMQNLLSTMMLTRSPFHLVSLSPWPIFTPVMMMGMAVGTVGWLHTGHWCYGILNGSFWFVMITGYLWWRDVVRESRSMGYHTVLVVSGLRLGVILFIGSEVCFFVAFFWGFFHNGGEVILASSDSWPPSGTNSLGTFEVPFLNTMVLLCSGFTLTLSHWRLMNKKTFEAGFYMFATVFLGVYFTFLQWGEYAETDYNSSDNSFGSAFYMATGFHGLHVVIGTTFLCICLYRIITMQFTDRHHTGLEAAAWYWHFVDVVWMFLFISVYWWGG